MQSISPQQRAQLAATIGLTPEQFEQFSQQMQNMPREQLRQLLGALGGGGMPRGGGGGGGGAPLGVVRLTREEAEAVGRLCELGSREGRGAGPPRGESRVAAANLLFTFGGGGPCRPGLASDGSAGARRGARAGRMPRRGARAEPDDDDDMYTGRLRGAWGIRLTRLCSRKVLACWQDGVHIHAVLCCVLSPRRPPGASRSPGPRC